MFAYRTCCLINSFLDDAFFIDDFRVGNLEVVSDLSAPENFQIALGWLRKCETEHENCPADDPPVLPTRVVDTGVDAAFQDLHIVNGDGMRAPYVALSHCWGGKIHPLLTTLTLDSFAAALPYDELPPNFRDAITITRAMGIRYLWIDSLCIVQDSKQDWEKESVRMADIYRDSIFTISALSSAGSKCGILVEPPQTLQSPPQPVCLDVVGVVSGQPRPITVKISRTDLQAESLVELTNSCPLYSRGWCLQEAILSPRHLYYGREQLYWRCPHGFQDAMGSGPGRRFPSVGFLDGAIFSILFDDVLRPGARRDHPHTLQDSSAILMEYYQLVQEYSHRGLTYGSDKLPAFSGIAQRLHPVLGGHYLAGLFSIDIAAGLGWRAEWRMIKHAAPPRAPSWSWTVTDEMLLFDSRAGNQESNQSDLTVQLLGHDMELAAPSNPYGEVKAGSLTLKGLVKPLLRSTQVVRAWPCEFSLGTVEFDNEYITDEFDEPRGMVFYSLFRTQESGDMISVITPLGNTGRDWEWDMHAVRPDPYMVLLLNASLDESEWVEYASGLLLLRNETGNEAGAYRRVGVVRFGSVKYAWLRGWESRTLTLV